MNRRDFLRKLGSFSAVALSLMVAAPTGCDDEYCETYYCDGYCDYANYCDDYVDGYTDIYEDYCDHQDPDCHECLNYPC